MTRNKYPEETVQKILDAAHGLFLEKGYEQTTVLDIVERMGGLTRGAFYHHFKSKEEVLDALTDRMFWEHNPFEKVKKRDDLNGLEKIRHLVFLTNEKGAMQELTVTSLSALESPTFLKRLIDDNRDTLAPLFQQLIEEGVQDGSIKTKHPKLLSEVFTLLTNFWTLPVVFPCEPEESMERLLYLKEITDKLGLPLINNEMIEMLKENGSVVEK